MWVFLLVFLIVSLPAWAGQPLVVHGRSPQQRQMIIDPDKVVWVRHLKGGGAQLRLTNLSGTTLKTAKPYEAVVNEMCAAITCLKAADGRGIAVNTAIPRPKQANFLGYSA